MRSLVPLYWRDCFFTKILVWIFKKLPYWKRLTFLKNPYRENNIHVLGSVLWCVETLKILKVPWCVGSVLWCVKTLRFFLKSSLSVCVAPLLWCVLTLRFFKEPLCGLVLWCMWTKIKDSENLKINTVDDA